MYNKVFGIGLPKTGTTSLRRAFKDLGIPFGGIYELHNPNIIAHCGDPFVLPLNKYKSLDIQFPDAKFILTLRADVDTWYDSLCRWAEKYKDHEGLLRQRKSMYGARMPNTSFKGKYVDHWYGVLEYFNNKYGWNYDDKLLTVCWERGDGWDKLCEFLDKPVPDIPFPHKNKNK